MRNHTAAAYVFLGAILSACGGGGGSSTSLPGSSASPQSTMVKLAFQLGASASASSHARHLDYISRSTNGIGVRVRVNGGSFSGSRAAPGAGNVAADVSLGSADCVTGVSPARTCTVLIAAPVGYNDFEITAWDGAPASGTFGGNQLSNALVANQLVQSNQNNPIAFTLNGVVASVALNLNPTTLVSGTAATPTLTVLAKDSSGNIIIAPGTYVDSSGSPVSIVINASNFCTLGAPICTTPGTAFTTLDTFTGPSVTTTAVNYTGGPMTSATYSVASPTLTGNNGATLSFTNSSVGVSIPGSPTVTEYSVGITAGSSPQGIIAGPDGNLWFTEYSGNRIGRITTAGTVNEFSAGITAASNPYAITAGADGNLWFTENVGHRIGRITTAGTVTEFSAGITAGSTLYGIAAGADGNVWFTEFNSNKIGRITAAGTVTEFSTGITANSQPWGITAGPDGNLWFAENLACKIGRITPSGTVTEFSSGISALANPTGITAGPDGNLWFTEYGGNRIGRITTAGTVTEFSSLVFAPSSPLQIIAGRDGNLWFTELNANKIGRITTAGTVTEYSAGITANSGPYGITAGPDGNLWFTENNVSQIGKVAP